MSSFHLWSGTTINDASFPLQKVPVCRVNHVICSAGSISRNPTFGGRICASLSVDVRDVGCGSGPPRLSHTVPARGGHTQQLLGGWHCNEGCSGYGGQSSRQTWGQVLSDLHCAGGRQGIRDNVSQV